MRLGVGKFRRLGEQTAYLYNGRKMLWMVGWACPTESSDMGPHGGDLFRQPRMERCGFGVSVGFSELRALMFSGLDTIEDFVLVESCCQAEDV